MRVQDGAFVEIEHVVRRASGEVVEQSSAERPFRFVFGPGRLLPGLEAALRGLRPGEACTVTLVAADAFGQPLPGLRRRVRRERFPARLDIRPGATVRLDTPNGPLRFVVRAIAGDEVEVDFNHPLAGEPLTIEARIVAVRAATPDETAATKRDPCGHAICGQRETCAA